MSALVGASDVEYLGYVTFCGAVAASLAGIAFGWLSDLTRNRRGLIAAGLVLTLLLLLAVPPAGAVGTLIGIILLWQLALTMLISPPAAWAGHCVPAPQTGLLGRLLSRSPARAARLGGHERATG